MQTSRQGLNRKEKNKIKKLLFQTIVDLKNSDEAHLFLEAILSEVELEVLAKRLAIVHRLDEGQSYDQIKRELQTSSTTVATMAEQLKKNQGLRLALKKIRADEWAEKWASRFERLIGKNH